MPRQGTHTVRNPRKPVVNENELRQQEIETEEAQMMAEIRDVMSNVHQGVLLEHELLDIINALPSTLSQQYTQIMNIALGNVRKLTTNFLYREHSILENLIPGETPPEDADEDADEDTEE